MLYVRLSAMKRRQRFRKTPFEKAVSTARADRFQETNVLEILKGLKGYLMEFILMHCSELINIPGSSGLSPAS